MSASAFIVRREGKTGVRYVVRYRLGGRNARPQHGGSFRTEREARARRDWIAREIAEMRVPDLRAMAPATDPLTVARLLDDYAASRTDVGDSAQKTYRQARAALGRLGSLEVARLSADDVAVWIGTLTKETRKPAALKPKTVATYLSVLRSALDFARVTPNPARDRFVRLPHSPEEETSPPSFAEFEALRETILPRHRLAVELLEGTGLRIGELGALTWADVDLAGARLRVARGRTKGRTAGRRFVPIPPWLHAPLAALRAPEDRSGAVFSGLSPQTLRGAMARACALAGMPAYSPHDLRHRYTSLLVLAGVPITLVRQVVGHSRASVTLDVYSHVILDEPRWRLDALLRGVSVVSGLSQPTTDADKLPANEGGEDGMEDSGLLSAGRL